VNQVVFKETNEIFAMKILKKRHLIQTNSVDNTIAEKDILRKVRNCLNVFIYCIYVTIVLFIFIKIRHPFVVRLHYAFQTDAKVHLVMDFVNGYE
jgi:serine/threonine protein kinase